MQPEPYIEPLPQRHRTYVFLLLLGLFLISLPLLYLYATGYRFDFTETANLVRTGGIFISAERTGAEIYIDDELVRETRVFRRAFYAQSIDPGTHRVHVQNEGHHTWVKELPVYPHLVTEAQAFNLPLTPSARVLSEWQTALGDVVVWRTTPLLASSTHALVFSTSTATTTLVRNTEFVSLHRLFVPLAPTTTAPATGARRQSAEVLPVATTTTEMSTTTKESGGVRLYERDGSVYAKWIGSRENMPYYYCAEPYELIGTSTEVFQVPSEDELALAANTAELLHPVQQVRDDQECKPDIRLDSEWQSVRSFDFFPGSTDLVVWALQDGVYVIEVDDRGWQNAQPLLAGEDLDVVVENGRIYVYDGVLMYEMVVE